MNIKATNTEYESLLGTISLVYENGRIKAFQAVNSELVKTYQYVRQRRTY